MIFDKVKQIVLEEAGLDDISIGSEVVTLETKFIDELRLDPII